MATAEIVQFKKQYESQFVCTKCGADRDCACHAPGRRKDAVTEALVQNPDASGRQISRDTGIPLVSVQRIMADMEGAGDPHGSRDSVTGKDGKSYPAKQAPKDRDESGGALANFKMACNQFLPKLDDDDMKEAVEHFRQKSKYF